jgi:hypothetical protein
MKNNNNITHNNIDDNAPDVSIKSSVIYNEYDEEIDNNYNYKNIDEVLATIERPELTKFNFTQSEQAKNLNNLKKYITWFCLSFSIFAIGTFIFILPVFSGSAEILPVNSNPSNEKLSITSKRSPFFAQYNNEYYYSENKNGVWTLDLSQVVGKHKIKIGTYIDTGLFKIHSSKTEEYEVNRNYITPDISSKINQYYNISKGEFTININAVENYLRLSNDNQTLYETGGNENKCKSQNNSSNATILTCEFDFGKDQKELTYNLKVQDEYGNVKELPTQVAKLVPVNDFACDYSAIYITEKVNCIGSKSGKIIINDQEMPYSAKKRIDLPVPIVDGSNKIAFKMIDEHNFENAINLEFLYDKTPLKVRLASLPEGIIATSNKENTTVEVEVKSTYINLFNNKTVTKDLTNKFPLLKSTIINEGIPTTILNSEVLISGEEYANYRTYESFQSGSMNLTFKDLRGRVDTVQCTINPKEIAKKYYLKVSC